MKFVEWIRFKKIFKKLFFLLLIFFFGIGIFRSLNLDYNSYKQIKGIPGMDYESQLEIISSPGYFDSVKNFNPYAKEEINFQKKAFSKIIAAYERNDIKEVNRLETLINIYKYSRYTNERDFEDYKDRMMPIFEDIKGDFRKEEVFIQGNGTKFLSDSTFVNSLVMLNYYNYKHDLKNTSLYDNGPIPFLEWNMSNTLGLLAILVSIIYTHNTISREVENGSYKIVLLSRINRGKYYFKKYIYSLLKTIFTLFLPLILIFLLVVYIDGPQSFEVPIIMQNDNLTSLIGEEGNIKEEIEKGRYSETGLIVENFSGNLEICSNTTIDDFHFSPYYKYLIGEIITLILWIAFMTSLSQLFSTFIKNSNLAFLVSIISFGILFILGNIVFENTGRYYLLFGQLDLGRSMTVGNGVTFLYSIIFYLLTTLIVYFIGKRKFMKLEF